jgi:hypothetical protein
MISKRWQAVFAVGLAVLVGCGQPTVDPGPSYSELVVTYNAELETLDRLEDKREQLVNEFEAASAPVKKEAGLANLEGLLESAKDMKNEGELDLKSTSDPNELLDQLTERTGDVEQIAEQLLGGLLGEAPSDPEPTAEEIAAAEERQAAFDAELATLDAEIATQKERVGRARDSRDAAEAKLRANE